MTDDIMTGLSSLFDEYVPKEYPHVDIDSKAYHYMQGAIKALEHAGITGDMRTKILLDMVKDKKGELVGWEYVNIVCGDIHHV